MYQLLTAFAWVLGRLSTKTTDRLAKLFAFIAWDCLRMRRALVLRNLDIALGKTHSAAERRRIGRVSFYHFALTALEFFRGARVDIAGHVEMRGVEHVRAALAKGAGCYILCCHLGSWEAMGAACTRLITPSYVIVKKVGGESVDRWVMENRTRNGFLCIKRKKKGDAYLQIKETLGRGEIVGFVMDQARPGEPKLPFFGAPAKTNTSLAAINRRIPAPIVPAFIRRTAVGQHVVEFFPEVVPVTDPNPETEVLKQSEQFNGVVETMVRQAPEHYFWMHNRWK